jgi:hypothetical protein
LVGLVKDQGNGYIMLLDCGGKRNTPQISMNDKASIMIVISAVSTVEDLLTVFNRELDLDRLEYDSG